MGSPGVKYHVNDRPYYWVKEYSGNFCVSENIPGTEHGWCRTDPMSLKDKALSCIAWMINTNTSLNVGLVGIESEGFLCQILRTRGMG